MDDGNVQKAWERPWSTEEMRAHCSSWNLAGDAGLLKHLQEFSQNLMQKTHTAEVALDSLLEDMRNTSVDVQNATNALLMLSNNQFVENRVYDDCEDEKEEIETKGDDDKVSSVSTANGESSLIAKAAEAILLGMSVIDTKFECVEVPASDSEGEEDGQKNAHNGRKSFALVLEPKSPYTFQPLPHLIGSKEFMDDDRVGLGEDEEDEEEEEEEDDVHLSIGQDLVAQGLNDSGSSLAVDMGDEGIFDEDEVDDRRVPKSSRKQAWESSSSNGSDDLVVENNVMRKKLKKSVVGRDDGSPFGHEEDEGDIFGGKESSSGDEFMAPVRRIGDPPMMPKKSEKEDFDDEVTRKPMTASHKKRDNEPEKKKTIDAKSDEIAPKTNAIHSDSLFGPPKDDWKDDEDGDSIFAGGDGIFSGGRGLFDDLEDPFSTSNRRDTNRFQPPSLPEKPPAFKGEDGISISKESKGDIFGDDDVDNEQDVFASILTKAKPLQQQQKKVKEEAPKKQVPKAGQTKGKDLKGVGIEGGDSWLFDETDQDEPLWNVETQKEKVPPDMAGGGQVVSKADHNEISQKGDQINEESKSVVQPKLPVGARSFYAGGIDPFALGKKLTKELEDKRKIKQDLESDDDSGKMDVSTSTAAHQRSGNPDHKDRISEKKSVKASKYSPDTGSLFDDLDEGDDLFAPVNSKANKPKDITANHKGDLFDESLFAPKESPAISAKIEEEQKKTVKEISSGNADKSKNLFGDFASDEDDEIFASQNSLGPRSFSSKPLSKGKKIFTKSSDPLFDDILGKDGELFPGSLDKNVFSEKGVEDDLFSGFSTSEEGKSIKNKKKESSNSIKTDFMVPLGNDDRNGKLEDPGKVNHLDKTDSSDNLLGPLDVKSSEMNGSKFSKITEASHSTKEKPYSSKNIENEFDDIFGDLDDKLTGVNSIKNVTGKSSIDSVSRIAEETAKNVETKSYRKSDKVSKLENLFDDFGGDENDFLSSKKLVSGKSSQSSDNIFESKSTTKRTGGKDLFSEVENDGDDQKFFTPKGGKIEADPLYLDDPVGLEDDLFSSLKPSVVKKTPTPSQSRDEESLDFSGELDWKKTESITKKGSVKGGDKVGNAAVGKDNILFDEDGVTHVLIGGSGTRKSPPKTLKLEKVIPSPKPDSKVVDLDDDFLGSNDAEDERIVQAWMKGHPPPLRDSKVETATDDDITPGYSPGQSYDAYGPAKRDEQDCSYFADLPSASLLRSHGKERARIQSHRRPPSRKVRKGSAAGVDASVPVAVEEEVTVETVASVVASLPSRDSVEEDGGSQGTIEEWSTPEAALTSPPSALITLPPPRSNPLSPSTDEEQDFFDVLPVGHYAPPPPMDPPSHPSPFSDALAAAEDVWDKDDGALFEDAQPMEQGSGSLWGSSEPPTTPGDDSRWTPSEELPKKLGSESGAVNSKWKPSVGEEGRGGEDELFSGVDAGAAVRGGKIESEHGSGLPKKTKKFQGKKDSGKLDDDLWGNRLTSKLKDDIFAEDFDSSRSGDFDDIFQGQGDLFASSKVSAPSQQTKKVTKGNIISKGMGKSMSKLDSKSKAPVSLFDDEDDTEDLFSPHSSQPAPRKESNTTKKTNTTRPAVSEQPAKSSLVKVAADDSIFEDPLMVLKRKE